MDWKVAMSPTILVSLHLRVYLYSSPPVQSTSPVHQSSSVVVD